MKKIKKKLKAKKTKITEIIEPATLLTQKKSDNSKAISPLDPVQKYLSEIRKYPLLSKEDEHNLAVKYQETKDPLAAEQLVTSNLRFVVKIAAEYSKFGAKMIDLIQEGNIGLMHGVKEFNPYKGVKLITYAVWWIRGYIQEYLMKQYSMVKIGTTQAQRKLFYQLQRQKKELENLGLNAGIKQLSNKLGVSEQEIQNMSQRLNHRDLSLNYPLNNEDSQTLMDIQKSPVDVQTDEILSNWQEIQSLNKAVDELRPTLNEREKYLLDNRWLKDPPDTLQEIGTKYGVSREAIRQMEVRFLKKLKVHLLKKLNIEEP